MSGGSERQTFEVAKALDRSRFKPFVGTTVSDNPRQADMERHGVEVMDFPVSSLTNTSYVVAANKMRSYLKEKKIRLIHSFDLPSNILAAPVGRLLGNPIVLTSQRAHRGLYSGFYRKFLRFTDRLASGIVVNCEAMRSHLTDEEGVDPGKIHLCYNGIDTSAFHPAEDPPIDVLQGAETIVGTVCAFRPEKGLDTLVSAFALVERRPGVKLLLVGSGTVEPALRAQVAKLGIEDRTIFVPAQRNVAPWLRAIDVFVMPSLAEALSNSIMETMACGHAAVIASRVGGNPELVVDGKTGLLFQPANANELAVAIRRLLDDAALRQRLAETSSRRIHEQFTLAASAARMGEIYSNALEARAN